MSHDQRGGYGQYTGNPYGGGYDQGYASGNPYGSVGLARELGL